MAEWGGLIESVKAEITFDFRDLITLRSIGNTQATLSFPSLHEPSEDDGHDHLNDYPFGQSAFDIVGTSSRFVKFPSFLFSYQLKFVSKSFQIPVNYHIYL